MFQVTCYLMISKTEAGRVGYRKKYRVVGRVRVPAGHCWQREHCAVVLISMSSGYQLQSYESSWACLKTRLEHVFDKNSNWLWKIMILEQASCWVRCQLQQQPVCWVWPPYTLQHCSALQFNCKVYVDMAPRPSISNVVRILSSDTIWPPHPLQVCSALEFNHALRRVLAVHMQTALSLNQCEFCLVESQSPVDLWSCSVLTCADSTYQFVCSSITLLQLQPLMEYVWMTICPLLYCFVITKDLQMGTLLKAS